MKYIKAIISAFRETIKAYRIERRKRAIIADIFKSNPIVLYPENWREVGVDPTKTMEMFLEKHGLKYKE